MGRTRESALFASVWGSSLALFLITALIGFSIVSYLRTHLLNNAGQQLAAVASDIAYKLDLLMGERYGDILLLPVALRDHFSDPQYLANYLNQFQKAYPVYLWVGVADAKGSIIAATSPESVGKDRSLAPWFQAARAKAALDGDTVDMRDAEVSEESDGMWAVSFTAPLRDKRGTFLGALSVRVGVPVLEDVFSRTVVNLQTRLGAGLRLEYQFTNRNGDLIADSVLREEGKVNLRRLGLPSMGLLERGPAGYVEETHLRRNMKVLTGYAKTQGNMDFPGFGWGVLVRVGKSDLLAPIDRFINTVLLAGIALLGPVWGFILWTSHHLRRERLRIVEMNAALHALVKATLDITGKMDLEVLLQQVVETARQLAGATAAAFEFADRDDQEAKRLVCAGIMSEEAVRQVIEALPKEGVVMLRGVLPFKSGGNAPSAAPGLAVLSLPFLKSKRIHGRLYLLGKAGNKPGSAEFSHLDTMIVTGLLAQASVVIDHAYTLKSLRVSESTYRELLLESTGEGMIGVDPEGRCTFINKAGAGMLGYRPNEMEGQLLHQLAHHHFPDGSPYPVEACPLPRTLRTGQSCRLDDEVFWRRDGTSFPVEYSAYAIHEEGRITGAVVVFQDISRRKSVETRLVELVDKYEELVGSLDAIIYEADPDDFRVTYVNPQFQRLLGYDPQQWLGSEITWRDLIHPEDVDRVLAFCKAETQAGRNHVVDFRMRASNGGELWFQDVVTVVKDQDQPVKLCGVMVNVTQQRQVEKALRGSQSQLAAVFGSAMDAIIVVNADQRITLFNAAAETMFRCAADEVLGQSIDRFIPERFRLAHRDHIQMFGETGVTRRKMGRLGTVLGLRADGEEFPAEVSISREDTADGKVFTVVLRDVTERQRAEAELASTTSTLQAMLDASPLAIVLLDREGRVRMWNPAAERIFGWPAQEVLGESLPIVPKDKEEEFHALLRRVLQGESLSNVELRRQRRDGSPIDISLSAAPIYDATGSVAGLVGLIVDLTANKALEAQFRQAQKMEVIGQLAGGIAHDFNNMLTVILGYCELLLNLGDLPDLQKNNLEEIKRAGGRAATLTRQLLAFSRKQVLQPKILDLNEVVQNLKPMLQRLLGENIHLGFSPPGNLWAINADPAQLDQVLMNLAVNARDAMPDGGSLTIETANVQLDAAYGARYPYVKPGPHVMLAVSDTGVGMDAETQARIFEPFFTTKEKGKGTGLGLSTVYGIVKQSGGHIEVYSEVGRGTTFKIYLPRAEGEISQPERGPGFEAGVRGTETILLVEDEAPVRAFMRTVLEQQGYIVLEVTNGEEALLFSQRYGGVIHLLVTDLVMPGISGREAADQLVSSRPAVKVLYMSGYAGDTLLLHGVTSNEVPFLPKPFSPAFLLRKIREVLDGAKQ